MGMLRIWSPDARSMEVQIGDIRTDMQSSADGWWTVESPLIEHGADYAFIRDNGSSLPDPRSHWQPEGVHRPSRVLDHRTFNWDDDGWQPPPLASGIVYELHAGTFTPDGTFDGVIDRLDYLTDLGVTHVELMPVNGFSGTRNWGYDGVNLFAPQESYGGPDGLKRLVNACHVRGLGILLDVVYNHLGPEGNYLEHFGPYFTDRYTTPWGKAVNFDGPHSDEVRRFFCDNALMWLRDYHFDGLRIDAIHGIFDMSAVHILEQLAMEVDVLELELGRALTLIAESDLNDPRVIRPRKIGGYGIDAQWNDDFHHAIHTVLTGEDTGYYIDFGSVEDLAKALTDAFVNDGRYSTFRKRSHGRPVGDLSGHKLLGYGQTHDQVGNRARGNRLSSIVSIGKVKIAAALVFLSPFVPMIFQGEEWAASTPFLYFTDHQDPDLAEAVRQGRRREFASFEWKPEDIPDPQAIETFERSKLNWDESIREPHVTVAEWYRRLIEIRRSYPDLMDGRRASVNVRFDEDEKWLTLKRGSIIGAFNISGHERAVELGSDTECTILLASDETIRQDGSTLILPRESVAVCRVP